jgi:hypothetical protein
MAPVTPLARAASLVAVWLCAGVAWAAETTVSVYLPGYDAADWKALRGSVIKSVWKQSPSVAANSGGFGHPPSLLLTRMSAAHRTNL